MTTSQRKRRPAVIANKERFPDPILDGRVLEGRQLPVPPAGMVFFNDQGDECGALYFGANATENGNQSLFGLNIDQYKQQDIMGIGYRTHNGAHGYGITFWERPDKPFTEFISRAEEVKAMPAGPERKEAWAALVADAGVERAFVGRTEDGNTIVQLSDSKGRPRIQMRVDANDLPHLEFLDGQGNVVYSLPPRN